MVLRNWSTRRSKASCCLDASTNLDLESARNTKSALIVSAALWLQDWRSVTVSRASERPRARRASKTVGNKNAATGGLEDAPVCIRQ